MKKILLTYCAFILMGISTNAQTFGFGCLGLSGFYGGYGIHTYEATGLNSNLSMVYNSIESLPKFEQATGFRFGANILRAEFDNFFLSAKGFFQFAKESHSADFTLGTDPSKIDMELSSNHWGIGIDFGLPVFSFLDLKLLEGGITLYNIEFKNKLIVDESVASETIFTNDGSEVAYYIGTGLIINLVEGYVSIEGTAMYHFLEITEISDENGNVYPLTSIEKPFIEKGGFAAAVQLNIGFPL